MLYRGVAGRRNGNHGIALYPDVFLPCQDGFVGLVCNQLAQWLRFLELIGRSWGYIIPHCGHWAMIEHPDDFAHASINFLQTVE